MKKLVCKIFTIAIIGFLLSSSAMALNIRDLDDLEFQKVSIREKNSFIDSELDPRRLDILDRLKGSQRPEQAELRCRPLKGLHKIRKIKKHIKNIIFRGRISYSSWL